METLIIIILIVLLVFFYESNYFNKKMYEYYKKNSKENFESFIDTVKLYLDLKNKFSNKMEWVATKEELPPLHKRVLLYNIKNDNHQTEFIHEFDLTTERYVKNWTHWAIVNPPKT